MHVADSSRNHTHQWLNILTGIQNLFMPSLHSYWKHWWVLSTNGQEIYKVLLRKISTYFLICIEIFPLSKIHLLFSSLQEQYWTLWRFCLLSDFMEKLWANHHVIWITEVPLIECGIYKGCQKQDDFS